MLRVTKISTVKLKKREKNWIHLQNKEVGNIDRISYNLKIIILYIFTEVLELLLMIKNVFKQISLSQRPSQISYLLTKISSLLCSVTDISSNAKDLEHMST